MSYTQDHAPSRFTVNEGFFTSYVRGPGGLRPRNERYGYKAVWHWDEKIMSGWNRPLWEDCPHIHRTEEGARRCGQARLDKPVAS